VRSVKGVVTLRRVAIPSPNYSSRGSSVRLVVLHTAEGALTYQSLGSFFSNPSSGVSSHAGIDDTPNEIGIYVDRNNKAWTQGNANPYSVAAELCGFASWSLDEWHRHPVMLQNTAQWVAEECAAFGIPLVGLNASEAQGGAAGVCQHNDLGAAGGGHWDCGPGFPISEVLAMAGGAAGPTPTERKGRKMIAKTESQDGYWTTTSDGAVYAFGDAQFRGGANSPDVTQPGVEIISIEGHGNDGYWLLGSDGSVFAYGSAPFHGRPDRV
jgi:hypothetical protein